jgi:hypothetical protein
MALIHLSETTFAPWMTLRAYSVKMGRNQINNAKKSIYRRPHSALDADPNMESPVVGLTGVVEEWTFRAVLMVFPLAAADDAADRAAPEAVVTALPTMVETILARVLKMADIVYSGMGFGAGCNCGLISTTANWRRTGTVMKSAYSVRAKNVFRSTSWTAKRMLMVTMARVMNCRMANAWRIENASHGFR